MARERSKNQESQSQDIEQRHGGQFSRRDWGLPLGPFGMMRWFTDEMDRMFGNFGFPGTERSGRGGRMDRFSPQVDLFERDGQLVIRADLPGMNKDDVKVEITEDALIIDGERKYEHEQNEKGVFRSERGYGRFHREIPLPEGVKADTAAANFNNGVLEIALEVPQQTAKNRKRIEIQSGESGGKP